MRIAIWFDHLNLSMTKTVPEATAQKIYDSIACVGQIRSVDLLADDELTVLAHKSRYDNEHNPEDVAPAILPVPSEGWLPIETAPKNGKRFIVLAWCKQRQAWKTSTNAYWCSSMSTPRFIFDGWMNAVPMFWMPTPATPTAEQIAMAEPLEA